MNFDMRKTVLPKSDQLNADDLIGRTLTIKITNVTGSDSGDQPVSIHFEGDGGKPYKPCKSMRRVLIHIWTDQAKNYIGKSMTLYCDPKVTFGGMAVGGIRISHMSHIQSEITMALTASKANRKPFTVKPLVVAQAAPAAVSSAPAPATAVSEHDKLAKRIKKAIDTSPDGDDLDVLWNVDYADDLATLLKEKPDYHARLKTQHDERLKSFSAVEPAQQTVLDAG